MAFSEDLSSFFDTADFAVSASFTPAGGGDAQTADVIMDSPTVEALSGRVLSNEYEIWYRATDLSNISAGDAGTVDGVSYVVREIRLLDDGKLKAALLSKV